MDFVSITKEFKTEKIPYVFSLFERTEPIRIGIYGDTDESVNPDLLVQAAFNAGGSITSLFNPKSHYPPIHFARSNTESQYIKVDNEMVAKNFQRKLETWIISQDAIIAFSEPFCQEDAFLSEFLEIFQKGSCNQKLIFDSAAIRIFCTLYSKDMKLQTFVQANSDRIILTPNEEEFTELILARKSKIGEISCVVEDASLTDQKLGNGEYGIYEIPLKDPTAEKAVGLSESLGNVIIAKKGRYDMITDGKRVYLVSERGSAKRCGGQGAVLTSLCAVYCSLSKKDALVGCAIAAAMLRKAAYQASLVTKYGLTVQKIIKEIQNVVDESNFLLFKPML